MTAREQDREAFMKAVANLSDTQRQAVETIEGPVMVIAGPGTGKTQILTLRIANILLKTDLQPENILALTFTDSGAKAMRERLRLYIGSTAYRVPIYTFHGFAERLISQYPDAFPRIIGGRTITDVEKVELIETLLEDPALTLLRPLGNHTYYVPYLLSILSHLKQEYVTPDDLGSIIARQEELLSQTEQIHQKGAHKGKVRGEYTALAKTIAKNRELEHVYRRYEAALRAERWYDFDDMIMETVRALSSDVEMLRDLQETFQYILADEHQDVNGAQNKILEQLCNFHDAPNIFVVGDEKQAIYRFQGASLDNFLYFTDAFKSVVQISLTDNYRSGQPILDTAQALVTVPDENLMRLRVPLKAAKVKEAVVTTREFSHQAVEDDWLVTAVKEELSAGTAPEEVAIILRTNREVEAVAKSLRRSGVPVTASAEGDVLTHPVTQAIEALINFVLTDTDEAALFKVLHGAYWGLSTDDLVRIAAARSYDTSLASILSDQEKLVTLGVKEPEKALHVMEVQKLAREREVHEAPHRVLEYLLEASGFLAHIMHHDPFEGVRVVRRLYDEIEALVIRDGVGTLREVNKTIALRRRYGLPLQAPFITTSTAAVQVMTAHKSKGLEFETVFVPHVQDANWGGRAHRVMFDVPLSRYREAAEHDVIDDERRLLYVALTRAKRRLHLSFARESILGKPAIASRLLTDLEDAPLTTVSTSEFEAVFSPLSALRGNLELELPLETLRTLVLARGLSATSLNNLLHNPWDYFYRNLLRVPEVQALHLQFGTVIHSVLEAATAEHTKLGTWPDPSKLKRLLEDSLRRLPVSTDEYTRLHAKGLEILVIYIEHLKRTLTASATKEELSVKVVFTTGLKDLPEITLTGKMDRVDLDETGKAIRVVDYKTGKPKTRAAIVGETASSDGGYKRQLTFYALLLTLFGDDRYETKEGVLSFVEPSPQGAIKEESFIATDEEIEALRIEIIEALKNFLTGEFLTDESLAQASEYKDLALAFMARSN